MKTLICLVLCALVATIYAAPARSTMNQAEAQFWGTLLKGALKLAPHLIRGISGGVEVQDDDNTDDDDRANIEAFLNLVQDDGNTDYANIETFLSHSLQERAEMEGDALKKIAKGILKVGPKAIRLLGHGAEGALNLLPHAINALGGGVEVQDVDDDDLAYIEGLLSRVQNADDEAQMNALLQSLQLQDKVKVENFLKTLGHIGKGILSIFGKKK